MKRGVFCRTDEELPPPSKIDAMTHHEARAWIGERWARYMAMADAPPKLTSIPLL
jgi:hypothetical protein